MLECSAQGVNILTMIMLLLFPPAQCLHVPCEFPPFQDRTNSKRCSDGALATWLTIQLVNHEISMAYHPAKLVLCFVEISVQTEQKEQSSNKKVSSAVCFFLNPKKSTKQNLAEAHCFWALQQDAQRRRAQEKSCCMNVSDTNRTTKKNVT